MSEAMTRPQAASGRIVSSQFVALPSVLWISRCVGAPGQVASAVRKWTLLPQTSTVWLRIPAQRGDRSPQSLHFISQVSRPGPRQSQLALNEGLQGPAGSAGVVAQGGSDAGVARQAEDADGEVAEGGHDAGAAGGADLGAVLVVDEVADPVQPVFDGP